MKKNVGSVVGLYPTPVTIIGTEVEGKINWINIAHVGIYGVDKMLLSMGKAHHTNVGIKANKTLSINIVNEDMLVEADYVGLVSGKNTDKSKVFEYFTGELIGAPMIKASPIVMECEVVENFETASHDNFIVKPINTYVDDRVLNADGKIDYVAAAPVLFEMPGRQYLGISDVLGKCWDIGKQYKVDHED